MKTADAARGKWKNILPHFGIEPKFLDGKHHECPCNGDGKDRFRFSDQNGSGAYFCACSAGDRGGFGLLECKTGRPFAELAKEVDGLIGNAHESEPRQATYAERLRSIAKTTQRSAYLESRGLEVAPGLLWATNVGYNEDGTIAGNYSAMLGPITRAGQWQTFHVTYLDRGKKAAVECPRKILPGGSITGGGIELYPAAEEMGVAEGIETSIAAKILFDLPVHSAINASMLAKWEPPAIAKVVWIFADRDLNYAGEAGAYQLAHRLAIKGIKANVMLPHEPGDYNDVLLKTRGIAA